MVRHAETAPSKFWLADTPNADVSTMDVWEIVNHLLRSYHQVLSLFIRLVMNASSSEFHVSSSSLHNHSMGA